MNDQNVLLLKDTVNSKGRKAICSGIGKITEKAHDW